jgi:hypothetical protein
VSDDQAAIRTSVGDVRPIFAYNSWLLLTGSTGEVQRQVRSRRDVRAMLCELGLPEDEATDVAREIWALRPGDAATFEGDPQFCLPSWRASGLSAPRFVVAAIVSLAAVAGLLVLLVFLLPGVP